MLKINRKGYIIYYVVILRNLKKLQFVKICLINSIQWITLSWYKSCIRIIYIAYLNNLIKLSLMNKYKTNKKNNRKWWSFIAKFFQKLNKDIIN